MKRRGCLLALALGVLPARVFAATPVRIIDLRQLRTTMKRHRGRVLVLHLWASWCPPCLPKLALLGQLAREWRARGVDLVSVSLDDPLAGGVASLERILAERGVEGLSRIILRLENRDAVIAQIDPDWEGSIPALFFYDRRGKLKKAFGEEWEVSREAFAAAVAAVGPVKK